VTRALKLAPLLLLAFSLSAEAAAPLTPTKPFAKRPDDQLDFLFLASDRPVLIRLHLRAGDKPYVAVWEAFMDKLFAWFDKDNDGFLSQAEVARLMPAQTLSFQIQGAIGAFGGQNVPFATMDTNKDGKVSKEEFRNYYRAGGVSPLRYNVANTQAQMAKQTNESIFRRLGKPAKGRLSKSDAFKLPTLMDRCDENEDEMLVVAELNTYGEGESIYEQFQFDRGMGRVQSTDSGLVQILPATTAASLAQQVMARYDANKDGKLAPGENGLDRQFVALLDRNKDGVLDAQEVEAFFYGQPDVVLRGRVGAVDVGIGGVLTKAGIFKKTQRAEVVNQKTLSATLAKKVRAIDAENVGLELGDARIKVQATEGNTVSRLQGVKQFYLQQFDAADDKRVGYVEKGQVNDGNRFLYNLFTQADKNADGKLYRKEFEEWLDLMDFGGSAFVTLTVNDGGRSLFNLLDENSDGKLSIRELRGAWAKMAPLCKSSEGLSQDDVPRTLQIMTGQGVLGQRNVFFFFGQNEPEKKPSWWSKFDRTPEWFLKMDRNGDGDVSMKEWLGSLEKFEEIDADHDGLISAEEARAYEAKKKKAKK